MTLGSIAVSEVLLLLKIGFLVLLYLFIWRVVRTASKDLRGGVGQESMILAPQRVQEQKKRQRLRERGKGKQVGKIVVVTSPALRAGEEHPIDSEPLLVGRDGDNDLPLVRDEFASGQHARIEPRRDGVYVEDIGSTNGTFVNGARLTTPRKLSAGDVIRVGETDLRFEK
ncbi:MAG TPA: FHA domain-containing protein [Gaiellaceae bacterium]|nr:FHA domain-containing protein [Gaiellaceae bacterium]